MKNIYLLPTEKEQHSIIQKNDGLFLVQTPRKEYSGKKINLYITSDEEIKKGNWYITILDNEVFKADNSTVRIMNDANKYSNVWVFI